MAPIADRIADAFLTCVARWGVAKTTLDDVAREAGIGRATIYRTVGGKGQVIRAVLAREVARVQADVDRAAGGADDLEGVVVAGVVTVARYLEANDALQYLLAHEPDVVLPHVTFGRMGDLFSLAAAFADPHLARFLPEPARRAAAAEWLARVVLTYVFNPVDGVDLADPDDARHLLRTFVLPGLRAATPPAPRTATQES